MRPAELELIDKNNKFYWLGFPDRYAMQVSGLGMPPVRHWATRAPFQTGESHWGYAIGPRIINMTMLLRGCTRTKMYEKRMANVDMLSPHLSPMKLRFTRGDGQQYELHDVWYNSGYELDSGDQPTPTRQIGGVQLIAYDPIWKWLTAPLDAGEIHDPYGRTCVRDNTFTLSPQLVLPFTGPFLLGTTTATDTWTITNDGTWSVNPVITVVGPVDDFIIANTTTGKTLTWNGYSIAAGEVVTFDIPGTTITNGAGTNLIAYVGGNFADFDLAPGANNVTFWASGGVVNGVTTVVFCWYVEVLGT